MPLEVKAFGCAPFAGKHAQRIVAVGHVKHLVLKKVRNSGRRVVHLSAEGEAPVRAAVIGGKNGIRQPEAGLCYNVYVKTVAQLAEVQILADLFISFYASSLSSSPFPRR